VVIDHFGFVRRADFDSAAANCLLDLVASGQAWVKLSGSGRLTDEIAVPTMAPLAHRLANANPEQVIWGSDWPHTPVHRGQPYENHDAEQPYRDVDTARLLQLVPMWFEDRRQQELLLLHNPARLYGFTEAS